MTCKDCVHYDVCIYWGNEDETEDGIPDCPVFKDKARFLNIGDKIYQHDSERIYESTIKNIVYETTSITFDERAISKTIFLTPKEAEEKLKEMK